MSTEGAAKELKKGIQATVKGAQKAAASATAVAKKALDIAKKTAADVKGSSCTKVERNPCMSALIIAALLVVSALLGMRIYGYQVKSAMRKIKSKMMDALRWIQSMFGSMFKSGKRTGSVTDLTDTTTTAEQTTSVTKSPAPGVTTAKMSTTRRRKILRNASAEPSGASSRSSTSLKNAF